MTEEQQTGAIAGQCKELLWAIDRLSKSNDAEWLGLDVGMAQFKAMIMLKEHGRQTVGGLARLLKVSESSASLLVEKLVTRDFVARTADFDDRRRTWVELSPACDELMTRLRHASEERLVTWMARLNDDDLAALHHGLTALLEATKADGPTVKDGE